jgi:chromosome condensin MukBEF ATPase and DNA-binding subunit MukB
MTDKQVTFSSHVHFASYCTMDTPASNDSPSLLDPHLLATPRSATCAPPAIKKPRYSTANTETSPTGVAPLDSQQERDAEQDYNDQESGDDFDAWWETVCSYIELKEADTPCNEHLQAWKTGVEKHEHAQTMLGNLLDDTKTHLEDSIVDLFSRVVAPIHQSASQQATTVQTEFGNLLIVNHKRRQKLLADLERSNEKWKNDYTAIVSKVMRAGEQANGLSATNSVADQGNIEQDDSVGADEKAGEEEYEPDWKQMALTFEPCAPHVDAFIQGSNRLQDAEESLRQALDEIHQQLQTLSQELLQCVVDIHTKVTPPLENRRNELQQVLGTNAQRRQKVQEQLEESVRQTQSILTGLMSRVSQRP